MKYIERAYPWLLISPVILPVVIWGGLIYPYLVPKTLLFYAISFLAIGAFAILATHGRAFYYARLAHRETWIPGALLVLAYIASIFGIDFYRSFWSLFVRGDGLLMLTCAVASFYLILLYANRAFFERLLRAVSVVATFVALYGIGEWLFSHGRIGSLLGNAAFFAGYLGIAFFATLAAARTLPQAWRRVVVIGAALQVVAIVLTATRGSMLALGMALIATLGYFALRGEGKRRIWSAVALGALVLLVGIFAAFRTEIAKVPFAPIARIATASVQSPDIASRLFIWKNMIGQIEKAPLLGVGAEHIDVLFNRFYDPTQIQEQWFDRSHNAFLDYAAQYGIFGLLLYLALISSFFIGAMRLTKRGERHTAGLFALLAIAYAVQNFFVFDTISSFWLLLALLAALLAVSLEDSPREVPALPAWLSGASWALAALLLGLIIPVSFLPMLAAYDLAHAYAYQLTDPQKEMSYFSQGVALGTYGNLEYGYEAYDMYANNQVNYLSGQTLDAAYQSASSILTANFNRYTYDARTALYLAQVLSIAPPGVTINNSLLSAALARAIRLSPKRSQPWYILVNLSISHANTYPVASAGRAAGYAAAQDILSRYILLVPALAEPHFVLAQLYFATGNTAAAAAQAAQGKADYRPSLNTARRAASYYEGARDWGNAVFFLNEIVQLDPSDNASRYDLAKAMYLAGNRAGAESIVAGLRTSDPAILGTDPSFLSVITAYEQSKK